MIAYNWSNDVFLDTSSTYLEKILRSFKNTNMNSNYKIIYHFLVEDINSN